MYVDLDLVSACKALGLDPGVAIPKRSPAWIRAERAWSEIYRAPKAIVEHRKRKPLASPEGLNNRLMPMYAAMAAKSKAPLWATQQTGRGAR
mgnify:CR=1 FL=1